MSVANIEAMMEENREVVFIICSSSLGEKEKYIFIVTVLGEGIYPKTTCITNRKETKESRTSPAQGILGLS